MWKVLESEIRGTADRTFLPIGQSVLHGPPKKVWTASRWPGHRVRSRPSIYPPNSRPRRSGFGKRQNAWRFPTRQERIQIPCLSWKSLHDCISSRSSPAARLGRWPESVPSRASYNRRTPNPNRPSAIHAGKPADEPPVGRATPAILIIPCQRRSTHPIDRDAPPSC